ncbi:MAG: septum formation initiator family protein [Ignavibacteriales bacterium]|nr:septum formation initiator family protein [Ignavibacteriales bacterium]
MDDQYYRKVKPKFKGWLNKTLRKKNVLIALLIALPAISFMMFSNKGIIQRLNFESEKKAMQEKIQQALKEQRRLEEETKALDSDPKAIEKVAREKYGMIKEGETVYKVKKEKQ